MIKFSSWKTIFFVCVFCAVAVIGAPAQTASTGLAQGGAGPRPDVEMIFPPSPIFTTLFSLGGAAGGTPLAGLVQGADGNLYGTAEFEGAIGGSANGGTVFEITTAGVFTTLHSFGALGDGDNPDAGLVLGTDGNFYGTTSAGGANCGIYIVCGMVFKITPTGTLTTLYSFCPKPNCASGANPTGNLVQATDNNFYGTTAGGGANNAGTVMKISTKGTPETTTLTTLYSFCAQTDCADGADSNTGVVQGIDGSFYGTTYAGGAYGNGTVFKVTPKGRLTTLYSFCPESNCTDGSSPFGPLVQATEGDFYGMTSGEGAYGYGTVFKITSQGRLTTLYGFCAQADCADGSYPSSLIQATDDNFYGTTSEGGAYGYGTVFMMTPTGVLTTLYSFCQQSGCPDGANPVALLQYTDGAFYGTALAGGSGNCWGDIDGATAAGCGTVFSLDVGLGPFVKTLPTSGWPGKAVIILGNNLTGATGVSFNGTAATFTVVSDTEIETTVPCGATTGIVQVTTPSGTLESNVPFRVIPLWARCVLPRSQ